MVEAASALITHAREKHILLTTAESCTGGMVAAALTDIAGSSDVFMQSIIAYANEAKASLLGVDEALIASYGAVSADVACAMAEGAAARLQHVFPQHEGDYMAVSVTGIAGPGGGSEEKPVGLVYSAVSVLRDGQYHTVHEQQHFEGDRAAVRLQTVDAAIAFMQRCLTRS